MILLGGLDSKHGHRGPIDLSFNTWIPSRSPGPFQWCRIINKSLLYKGCKPRVVTMLTLSSLVAPVVVITTLGAAIDDKVGIMLTLGFHHRNYEEIFVISLSQQSICRWPGSVCARTSVGTMMTNLSFCGLKGLIWYVSWFAIVWHMTKWYSISMLSKCACFHWRRFCFMMSPAFWHRERWLNHLRNANF